METKQILIEIIGKFVDKGLNQGQASINRLVNALAQLAQGKGGASALGRLGSSLSSLIPALGKLTPVFAILTLLMNDTLRAMTPLGAIINSLGQSFGTLLRPLTPILILLRNLVGLLNILNLPINLVLGAFKALAAALAILTAPIRLVESALGGFGNALKNLPGLIARVGFGALRTGFDLIGKAASFALSPIRSFFDNFLRVAQNFIAFGVFQKVKDGFDFIKKAAFDANAELQRSEGVFGAFTRSAELGSKQLAIVRQIAIETGVPLDDLAEAARRIPQATGQNLEAFTEIIRESVALAFLDPTQGVAGAVRAIVEATEGTLRGFTPLATRFEINKNTIRRALEETANPLEAVRLVLEEIGVTEEFVTAQTNSFTVAMLQIKSVFAEVFRIAGQPIFERISASIIKLRDRLFELRPQLFGIAAAVGEFALKILDAIGLFQESFIETLDPFEIFQAAVNLMRSLTQGFFTGLNQYVLPAIIFIANTIADFFVGASPPQVGPLSQIVEGGKETIKAYVEGLVAGLDSAIIKQIAQEITSGIINLEGQVLAQEKAIESLEDFIDQAEKELQAARDKLSLFDIQSADIPERFTRARRRELQLEILAREQEVRRRREALDAAKEQLSILKEALAAQNQVLSNLESILREVVKAEEEAEKVGGELDKSFKDIEIAPGLEEEMAKAKARAEEILKPLLADFTTGFGELKNVGQVLLDTFGRFSGLGDEIITKFNEVKNFIEGLITTIITKWNEVKTLFDEKGAAGILEAGFKLGLELATKIIAGISFGFANFLKEANIPLISPLLQWVERTVAEMVGKSETTLEGSDTQLEAASKKATNPIAAAFEAIKKLVVGESIVPEMLTQVESAFETFPMRLEPHLDQLALMVAGKMSGIRNRWFADWLAMAEIATQIQGQFGTRGALGANLSGNLNLSQLRQQLNLNLDAGETRKLMEEGVYTGIVNTFGT